MMRMFETLRRAGGAAPSLRPGQHSSANRGVVALLILVVAMVSMPVVRADAATVTTFTGPVCQNGTTSLLAQWAGAGLPTNAPAPTAGTTINLNTTASGYPAGSIKTTWVSATGTSPFYNSFTPNATGFPSQYAVPSLEMGTRASSAATHVIDITFPAPTVVYFPIFDVDTNENGRIEGFNGTTPVAGSVSFRNPISTTSVTQSGTASIFTVSSITNYPDADDRGLLDVWFGTPVTRIRITDYTPAGSNEIGDLYSCQSQDLVKSATTPTFVSATANSVTYQTQMTLTVGNSQPTGGMRIYQPQVTDNLATVLGGSPTYSAATVTSIAVTGPSSACTANSGYTGTGVNTMLAAPAGSFLAPGQRCVITVGINVTYPYTATTFTKNNTATASGAGTNATISDGSTNGTSFPTTPKGDTPSPTPLVFPPFSPSITLTKVANKATMVVGETLTYTFTATNTGNVTLQGVTISENTFSGAGAMSALQCPAPGQPATLAPGGTLVCTATYVVLQADVDATQLVNTANVTGNPPVGPAVTANDDAAVTATPAPGIDLVKSVDKTSLVAGETLTYTFTATNTGNVTLTQVSITEASFSGSGPMSALNCAAPTQPATLSPGGVLVCTATYVVTQADVDAGPLTNLARASGTPLIGPPVVDFDQVLVAPTLVNIQIEKIGQNSAGDWNRMEGSAFQILSDAAGAPGAVLTQYPVAAGAPGVFNVINIAAGTYWLVETQAPAGFSLLAQPVKLTVTSTGITIGTNGAPAVTANGMLVTVRDVPVFTLPTTGGSGALAWQLVGGILLLLAVPLARVSRKDLA